MRWLEKGPALRRQWDMRLVLARMTVAGVLGAIGWPVIGCSLSSTGPSDSHPVTLSGRVLDYQTDAAVPGMIVSLGNQDAFPLVPRDDLRSTSDQTGTYHLSVISGVYTVFLDGIYQGSIRALTSSLRADLLAHANGCTARYGVVLDGRTGLPVAAATVRVFSDAVTSADGWYRLNLFCCPIGTFCASGTVFMTVTKAGYVDQSVIMGRGENLSGLVRTDVMLQPR